MNARVTAGSSGSGIVSTNDAVILGAAGNGISWKAAELDSAALERIAAKHKPPAEWYREHHEQ